MGGTGPFHQQLWATDGASDTRVVATNVPADHDVTYEAAGLGSHVLFTARVITPQAGPFSPLPIPSLQVWRADADGRNPLRLDDSVYDEFPHEGDISADSTHFRLVDQLLFYRSRDELSVTDGTLAGTRVVRQLVANGTGPSFSRWFVATGAASLFSASDGLTGEELWRTDGTAGGTLQVMDIKPGSPGARPEHLKVIDNLTYFDADDGVHGRELWVSDGTASGTRMIADNLPGPAGSTFDNCASMLKFNGFVYFGSRNGGGGELWRTDNTPGGTTLVWGGTDNSCPRPLALAGSTLYFAGGGHLWRTDGSGANPQQVGGLAAVVPFPDTPAQFRGELVVSTASNITILTRRTSLWSIGAGSPRLLLDFADPANGSLQTQISWVIATDDALYFAVNDFGRGTHSGIYRWAGGSASPERFVSDLVSNGWVSHFGPRIVFIAWSAATGQEIIISDGTTAGTQAITDVSGPGEQHLGGGFVVGPALYFTFVDALFAPSQVGRSNGTLQTFARLTDLIGTETIGVGVVDGELIYATDDVRETVGEEPYIIRNQRPRAGADSATVAAGQSVTIALATNDSDDDGEVIAWGARIVSAPAHGTVTINSEGIATYQANGGFGGTDTFSYVAADNGGRESVPATVTVTVQGGAGPGAPSEPSRRSGGGSSGWLLLLALAAFVARRRNHAADPGVYAYRRLCVRSMSASVSAGFSARRRLIRATNASAGTAGLQ
jgi:ELWxxDGT repeat protein